MLISTYIKYNLIHVILENKLYSIPAINHMRWISVGYMCMQA